MKTYFFFLIFFIYSLESVASPSGAGWYQLPNSPSVISYEEALSTVRLNCEYPVRVIPGGSILSSVGSGDGIDVIGADEGATRGGQECSWASYILSHPISPKHTWVCVITDSRGTHLAATWGKSQASAYSGLHRECEQNVSLAGLRRLLCHQQFGVPCFHR